MRQIHSRLPVPAVLEHVACALCGRDEPDVLLEHDSFGFPIGLVECRACGFVYATPRPSEAFMMTFYRDRYRLFYEGQRRITDAYIRRRRWDEAASARVRRYAALVPLNGRVLDVGCGAGMFLHELRRVRDDITGTGIEPNRMQAEYARHTLGLDVRQDMFQDFEARAPYDLVVAFHIVEHIHDLGAFFGFLRRVVRETGHVVIETPNLEGPWCGIGMFHIAHLYAFSAATIARVAAHHGFVATTVVASADGWDASNLRAVLRPRAAAGDDQEPLGGRMPEALRVKCRGVARPRWTRVMRSWIKLAMGRIGLSAAIGALRAPRSGWPHRRNEPRADTPPAR
jgi:2-polyprenyl-3-methyl-5-hydroxy-6-metoxy-1,4-benzoquinol methylase